eukprot:scaffold220951_cov32-Tisochrysis_lutea.AAC.1
MRVGAPALREDVLRPVSKPIVLEEAKRREGRLASRARSRSPRAGWAASTASCTGRGHSARALLSGRGSGSGCIRGAARRASRKWRAVARASRLP